MKTRNGFTLIEILVVVVLLGVLAGIVVPKFSSATLESQTTVLRRDLQTVRTQIALYQHYHNGALPAGPGETEEDFVRRMTKQTDLAGDPGTEFGPYMLRVPINPFTSSNTVRIGGVPAGADTHAWRFDPNSGGFQSDDNFDGDDDGRLDHLAF